MGEREIESITSSILLRRRSEESYMARAVVFLASAPACQLCGQVLSVWEGVAMSR